ncbi:hypothetical protein EVAR_23334_1 [Eumeta japonica]|uniref:Uncharacterized protein n=1 Tax=Eumeta variegata TaxID=151549 RepID=A0A4C1XYF0_EUMVA|nr:hypothetical protein EVAR_23334_1 [Eumeta japonica]
MRTYRCDHDHVPRAPTAPVVDTGLLLFDPNSICTPRSFRSIESKHRARAAFTSLNFHSVGRETNRRGRCTHLHWTTTPRQYTQATTPATVDRLPTEPARTARARAGRGRGAGRGAQPPPAAALPCSFSPPLSGYHLPACYLHRCPQMVNFEKKFLNTIVGITCFKI